MSFQHMIVYVVVSTHTKDLINHKTLQYLWYLFVCNGQYLTYILIINA